MTHRGGRGRHGAHAGLLAGVVAGMSWVGPAALAQVAGEGPAASDTLEQITVTAQFRRQNVQDTPLAVSALSGATLEERGELKVSDLGRDVPNVNISPATSLYGNSVSAFIRGIGQYSSNFALEPGVGVYIDDVYYGTTFGAVFDLADLDRVEVLRGPQGILDGMNSIGGAVKLYSRPADAQGGGYLQATYGSYHRVDLSGSGDFSLADGLNARISGISRHIDGYLKDLDYGCTHPGQGIAASPLAGNSCEIGTEGGEDLRAVRLALSYAPTGSPSSSI